MRKNSRRTMGSYVRDFTFGVEDSLVSTVGLLSGVAVGGIGKKEIILTGLILVFVEAFSMSVGTLLSQQSEEEYIQRKAVPIGHGLTGSVIMFFSYFLSGLVPLAPYIVLPYPESLTASGVLALVSLFALGYCSASLLRLSPIRNGVKMLVIGGLAIIVGGLAGASIQRYL